MDAAALLVVAPIVVATLAVAAFLIGRRLRSRGGQQR